MRPAVYIDAFTLACPSPKLGIDSFGNYIQNLLNWNELRRTEWIDIYTSRDTAAVLFEVGAYPPWPELQRAIDCLGIQHVQVRDIVEIINGFLQRTLLIENELELNDLLFDQYGLSAAVDYTGRPGPFIKHLELLTVLLALHKSINEELDNMLLVSCPDLKHHGNTQVTAAIIDLACSSSTSPLAAYPTPFVVTAQFAICICLHTLHSSVDACCIWSSATCHEVMHKAIEVFAYQQITATNEYFNVLDNHPFSFGVAFIESSRASGFFNDPIKIRMLLRGCVETVMRTNLHAVHALRSDEGSNSPQLTRGTDKAWRRDIDRDYHLHYWETPEGFELADVVHHNDFKITF